MIITDISTATWTKINDFLLSLSSEKSISGLVSTLLREIHLLVPFGNSGNSIEIDSILGGAIVSSVQCDKKWEDQFNRHFSRIATKPTYTENIISASRDDLKRNNSEEYYYDFLSPQKIGSSAGFIVFDQDSRPANVFLINRTTSERMFTDRELTLLKIIHPHVCNYYRIQCLLDRLLTMPVQPAELEKDTRLLSVRESEIVHLLFHRYRPGDISKELKISVLTVRKHIQNIYYKLRVSDRQQLFEKLKKQES